MDRLNARAAFLPLTERWLQYALQGFVLLLMLLLLLGEWGESYAFCAHCGLRRTLTGVRIATIFPLEWPRYRETNYHRLYARYVSSDCRHDWRFTARGWTSLLGGGVACGVNPTPAFGDYPPDDPIREFNGSWLPSLTRLHDPGKIRQVLARVVDTSAIKKQGPALVRAFHALDAVTNSDEEARWWRQYGQLFQGSETPTPRYLPLASQE